MSSDRAQAVEKLIHRTGYAAAALTLLPLPGTEIVAVMPLHVGMVVGIAEIHGRSLTRDSAMELVLKLAGTAGASLVGTRLATTAAKVLLPGLGGLLGAPVVFASTLALGTLADRYFETNGTAKDEELRNLWSEASRRAKQAFDPSQARSAEARDLAEQAARGESNLEERLARLQRLKDAGLIDQAEYDAQRQRILASL